jgi:alkaline phosphatase
LLILAILGWVQSGCGGEGREAASGRGVILFVGDGMGVSVVTAARIHRGALDGLERPARARLTVDSASRAALVQTESDDGMVTDSAAAMTAMMCGRKTRNGALSVAWGSGGETDTLATLLEIAESMGMSTGVVSTTRITHATPAACYAHTPDRSEEPFIAASAVPGSGNRRRGASRPWPR